MAKSLESWCCGHRTERTMWADWNIPLRWGANSDPFQPIEEKYRESLKCLQIFKKYQYPFVVCTKGKLCVQDEYFNLLKDCKCIIHFSLNSSLYDKIEPNVAPFEERITWIKKFADIGKRVVVRASPYLIESYSHLLKNIPRFAEFGAYAVLFEGMALGRPAKHFFRFENSYRYEANILAPHYEKLKATCHKYGLMFLTSESYVPVKSDSRECCGTEGLGDFKTNKFHLKRICEGCCGEPSEAMKKKGSAMAFKACLQNSKATEFLRSISFVDYINLKRRKE